MNTANIPEDVKAAVEKWRSEVVQRSPSWATYMAAAGVGLQAAYEAFQLGVAHEREACAKIADEERSRARDRWGDDFSSINRHICPAVCIALERVETAIRARGEE